MEIKCTFKGVALNAYDLKELHDYYEAAYTAKYIQDNYAKVSNDKALKLGYEVRRQMDKYDYDEEEAIEIMLSKEEF